MSFAAQLRDRRALLLGGAILLGALFIRFVALPYARAIIDARAMIAERRDLLARERELLVRADLFAAEAEAAVARLDSSTPALLPGETPSVAQAALTERVDAIADGEQVALTRLQTLPTTPVHDGVLAVPLRVEGESDLEGVLRLLARLEAGRWPIRIESLAMESRAARDPGRADGGAAPEVLGFRFTAVGFALADSASARATGADKAHIASIGGNRPEARP